MSNTFFQRWVKNFVVGESPPGYGPGESPSVPYDKAKGKTHL